MNELELNLQKQELLEKEITELETKAATLTTQDKGLEDAVSAKKKQLVELNEQVKTLKAQDTGNFERARQDNVNAAFSRLIASEPDLQNAELQAKLKSAFGKFDEGHFNPDEIYKDIRFAWLSLNRDKAFSALDAFGAMPEEIRKQQEAQLAGAGARSGSQDGKSFSDNDIETARQFKTSPEYVEKAKKGTSPSGGLLTGSEKPVA